MRPVVVSTTDASGGTTTSSVVPMDMYGLPEVAMQINVTGTVACTIQSTMDDVFDSTVTPVWLDHPDTNLVGATASVQGNYAFCPRAIRMQQTSGSGSATLTLNQAGVP